MRNQWDIVKDGAVWRLQWRRSGSYIGMTDEDDSMPGRAICELTDTTRFAVENDKDGDYYWHKRDDVRRFRAALNKRIRELEQENRITKQAQKIARNPDILKKIDSAVEKSEGEFEHKFGTPKSRTLLYCPACGAALQVIASYGDGK